MIPDDKVRAYPFLATRALDYRDIAERMKTLRMVGVPYTDEMIVKASADIAAQTDPDGAEAARIVKRYPKAQVRKFDSKPGQVSELDALIAYLQMLGTLVDFAKYDESGPNLR